MAKVEELKRTITVLLCVMLMLSSGFVLLDIEEEAQGRIVEENGTMYTIHAPIMINSNSEFIAINGVTNAATGDGTEGNPWIIEGWEINASGLESCIYIGNTTDRFIIQSCHLTGADDYPFAGIEFNSVYNGTVSNCSISHNYYGINLGNSYNNSVEYNNVAYNGGNIAIGQDTFKSTYNKVLYNNITGSSGWCIRIDSENNTIYHNNFINYTFNGVDWFNNQWDNGYPSGGNYWDSYGGIDSDRDGIGDTPHTLSGGGQDNYPLIEPVWGSPPNSTINGTYLATNESPIIIQANSSDIGSGVKNLTLWYRHSLDNITWSNWTKHITNESAQCNWSFNLNNLSNFYEFKSQAIDYSGYVEDIEEKTPYGVLYDEHSPLSKITVIDDYNYTVDSIPRVSPEFTINLTANDGYGSGINKILFRVWKDNATNPPSWKDWIAGNETWWKIYTGNFSLTDLNYTWGENNGYLHIDFFAYDNLGNYESSNQFTLYIVKNYFPPYTLIEFSHNVSADFVPIVESSAYFSLNVSNQYPIKDTFYRRKIDEGTWQNWTKYSTPVLVSYPNSFSHTVECYSINALDINETVKSYNFRVDNVSPSVISTTPSDGTVDVSPYISEITIEFDEYMDTKITDFISVEPHFEYILEWDDSVLSIIPASLLASNMTYSFKIGNITDLIGHPLSENYVFIFTTTSDTDGDGAPDDDDAFPLDADEYLDTDNDGIGNNADTDDDGDGVPDDIDEDPLDPEVGEANDDGPGGGSNYIWIFIILVVVAIAGAALFLRMRGKPEVPEKMPEPAETEDTEEQK